MLVKSLLFGLALLSGLLGLSTESQACYSQCQVYRPAYHPAPRVVRRPIIVRPRVAVRRQNLPCTTCGQQAIQLSVARCIGWEGGRFVFFDSRNVLRWSHKSHVPGERFAAFPDGTIVFR
jgi:hypothetical protein